MLAGRLIVAPVKVGARLSTLELIDEAGRKSALAGGQKGGGYWAAQKLPDGDGTGLHVLIAEGISTALSVKAGDDGTLGYRGPVLRQSGRRS